MAHIAEPVPQVCNATFAAVFPVPLVTIRVSQLAQLWRTTLLTAWSGPFVPLSTTITHESVQLAQFIAAGFAALMAAGAVRLASNSAPFSEATALKPKLESTRADAAVRTREKRVNVFISCFSILFFDFQLGILATIIKPRRRAFYAKRSKKISCVFLLRLGYQICEFCGLVMTDSQLRKKINLNRKTATNETGL